jgi:ABC-type uncharacterized transport system substrate-binding protein
MNAVGEVRADRREGIVMPRSTSPDYMDRRAFVATLAGALIVAPPAAEAQEYKAQPDKLARLGFLGNGSGPATNPVLSQMLRSFREGLGEFGYVEGQNLAIDYRYAEGRADRLGGLIDELIGLSVDAIFVQGPAALKAAKARRVTVPIVAIDFESDPVAAGFAASLARPGGNITGTFLDQAELSGKWLELWSHAI